VLRVRHREDGRHYAVKVAREKYRGASDRARKLEEVRKHQVLLPHNNCVHFYQSWEENGRLYQQFELCEASLADVAEKKHELPESIIWSYAVDLLLAVKHLHDHNLIHMDIKPENIFIGMDGICKLGDFGLVIDLTKVKIYCSREAREGSGERLRGPPRWRQWGRGRQRRSGATGPSKSV